MLENKLEINTLKRLRRGSPCWRKYVFKQSGIKGLKGVFKPQKMAASERDKALGISIRKTS